jgi:hypothetical protein
VAWSLEVGTSRIGSILSGIETSKPPRANQIDCRKPPSQAIAWPVM